MNIRLLLSSQRSGSHFLKSLIEAHFSGVVCTAEILDKPATVVARPLSALSGTDLPYFWNWYEAEVVAGRWSLAPDQRLAAFAKYLTTLAQRAAPHDVVFDAKYNSLRTLSGYWDSEYGSGDFTSFVAKTGITTLHLIRRNLLRMAVSERLAEQTGVWHRFTDRPADEVLPKIRLDYRALLVRMKYWTTVTQNYRSRLQHHPGYLELCYEDLVEEREGGSFGPHFEALARFLEKTPSATHRVPLPYKKTSPDDPAEVVENWDEICRALRKTEFGWMTESLIPAGA